MAINKQYFLDETGVDTLLEEVFGTISDHYVRLESIDSELDSTSTNPVKYSGILSAVTQLYGMMNTISSSMIQNSYSSDAGDVLMVFPPDDIDHDRYYIYPDNLGKDVELYAFEIDLDESEPSEMINYQVPPAQSNHYVDYYVDNYWYDDPAHMDYTNDTFDYGDWANAWFIKGCKPCMLKYDGTVDYYLDPNDYSKKLDGTASDYNNDAYDGNVMVGIPTVWIKVDTSNSSKPKFYFSNKKLGSDYHAYAHTNSVGDIMPYTYMAAYDAWNDGSSRLRSISSKVPTRSETGSNQITQCRANNLNGATIWDLHTLVDHELITLLLMLIGKSTNSQAVFGFGNGNGISNPATGYDTYGVAPTGTMNDKGLFWGSNEDNLGVKVFGIEHFWGNIWKRTQGLINDNGTIKYKLTRGTYDGSTASDYNTTGSGYLTAGTLTGVTSGSFITDMYVGNFGFLPKATDTTTGSASTYYCDKVQINNSRVSFALFGGYSSGGSGCGTFYCGLSNTVSNSIWVGGAALSCKPLLS